MERTTTLLKEIGGVLRDTREAMGLTQTQMAERCGVSVKHYGDIERGTIDFGLTALDTLARGAGMKIAELCGLALGTPIVSGKDGTVNPVTLDARTVRRVQKTLPLVSAHLERLAENAETTTPRYRLRGGTKAIGRYVMKTKPDEKRPVEIYWTLALDVGMTPNAARAELWLHEHGYELRIVNDGIFRWGHIYRDRAGADHDAEVARQRLEERGWHHQVT
ncbi:MAG: helix-turn-helix domain-containing protein [Vicinamibacteraceae bacterium]